MCFGSSGGADAIAKQQRQDEVDRQNRIKQGMSQIDQVFSGFGDPFYAKRYSDYMGYAEPQIDQQATQQRKSMIYDLARTGNLDSSAANEKNAELQGDINQRRIDASNEGQNQENALRGQVENTRGNIVSELNATGDSTAASQAALRATQNLNQPAGFSPLGNLFADFANSIAGIGSRAANNYSGFFGGGPTPLFSTGSGSGSSRVVGG